MPLNSNRYCVAFVLGLLLVSVGCSNPFKEKRPTPLPNEVEPFDVRNANLEPLPPLTPEAKAYLSRFPQDESATAKGLIASGATPQQTKSLASKGGLPPNKYAQNTPKTQTQLKIQSDAKSASNVPAAARELSKLLLDLKQFPLLDSSLQDAVSITKYTYVFEAIAKKAVADKQQEEDAKDKAERPGNRYNTLVLSGGVAHGAYQVGIMSAWKDRGDLPVFDVVTGVSTGALIGAAVFPGTQYYDDLKRLYTTTTRRDVYHFKYWPPLGLGSDSLATNEPLRKLLHQILQQPCYFEQVAAEHAKGRRFYVGTTNIDTMRFVTWDMGAIASMGTPESRKLYEEIVLGASALPVLFPPSKIGINIDGQQFTEFHSDGGTTRNLFIYPPADWPGSTQDPYGRLLAGAKVFVLFGGKVYGDPDGTDPKLLSIGIRSLATLLASCQRAEMFRIFAHCHTRDMEFKLAAIPEDLRPLFPSAEFDPVKMTKLYCLAYTRMMNNEAWNEEELLDGITEVIPRRSACLSSQQPEFAERGGFSLPPPHGLRPPTRQITPSVTKSRSGSFLNR